MRELHSVLSFHNLGNDLVRNPLPSHGLHNAAVLLRTSFLQAFLHPLHLGIDQLVVSVTFGCHILLVSDFFIRRKCSDFRRIKQELEDFLLHFGGSLREMLHLVKRVAEVLQEHLSQTSQTLPSHRPDDYLQNVEDSHLSARVLVQVHRLAPCKHFCPFFARTGPIVGPV